MPRKVYPSDHRRWFRVAEDILDDPKLNGEEWVWGAYFRTLAMLNRVKSRDGSMRVSGRVLGVMMGRSRGDVAAKRLGSLAHLGLISAARYADYWLILVPNWPKHQGFTPAQLRRDSGETPSPTPTPTPTPTNSPSERAAPARSPWLNMLKGAVPEGHESAEAWLSEHEPIIAGEAEAATGETKGAKFNGKFKSLLMRYWRNKAPPSRPGGSGSAPKSWAQQQEDETLKWLENQSVRREPRGKGTSGPVRRLPERSDGHDQIALPGAAPAKER